MNAQEQKKLYHETSRLITAINIHLRMPTNHTYTDLREASKIVSRLLVERTAILAHTEATQRQLQAAAL